MHSRVKKFLSYYKPYLGLFCADMFCACMASAIALAIPLCIRDITKNLLVADPSYGLSQIYIMAGILIGLVALYTACQAFIDYRGHVMGALMERDMRSELFDHYQKLSFNFYDEHRTGQLMSRITSDTYDLAELFHHAPEEMMLSLVKFIGAFVILSTIQVKLALVAFLFIPIMSIYGIYFSRRMHRALRESKGRIGDINAQVEDTLSGIRVVKSFTNEEIEKKKFTYENERFINSRKTAYKSEAYFYDGLNMFTQLMTVFVVILGAVDIIQGSLDLADLLTFLLYIGVLIEPVQRFANFTRLYYQALAGFERLMEMLEIHPDIKDSPDAAELTQALGNIEFKKVSFQYKEGYEHVLKEISLNIKVGEYVALVGPSGVGKTTLCSLIPRFYEVSQGEILIDGKDIRRLSLSSLRRNIGIVQQDVYLFAGTVSDNIRYGKLHATEEEIIESAKKANAHDFIMSLPNGYATDIGQRGIKLSGGQKQRLSVARAFLKDPRILIFDEATSSLDNESEKAVKESLERLTSNRTTLVIAHRLSTVRNAKRIIVLTDKGIEEQGTHEELMKLKGAYASLYEVQLMM